MKHTHKQLVAILKALVDEDGLAEVLDALADTQAFSRLEPMANDRDVFRVLCRDEDIIRTASKAVSLPLPKQ